MQGGCGPGWHCIVHLCGQCASPPRFGSRGAPQDSPQEWGVRYGSSGGLFRAPQKQRYFKLLTVVLC